MKNQNNSIDSAKRNTLKAFSLMAAGIVTAGSSIASELNVVKVASTDVANTENELANIEVNTRISAIHNDLEVVVTNAGDQSLTITQMTPKNVSVARGDFDFSALVKNGPRTIAAGESVVVPLRPKSVSGFVSDKSGSASLSGTLRQSMSIVTEGDAFASITIKDRMMIA